MNASLRWALVAIALGGGWMLFGERIRPVVESWLAPIEPTEYTRSRGDLDATTVAPWLVVRILGPQKHGREISRMTTGRVARKFLVSMVQRPRDLFVDKLNPRT